MTTRADFYVGIDDRAEWLGSLLMDGGPEEGHPSDLVRRRRKTKVMSRLEWKKAVDKVLRAGQGVKPADGWPHAWDCSVLTNYCYTWHDGKVYVSNWASPWADIPTFWRDQRKYEKLEARDPRLALATLKSAERPDQFPQNMRARYGDGFFGGLGKTYAVWGAKR